MLLTQNVNLYSQSLERSFSQVMNAELGVQFAASKTKEFLIDESYRSLGTNMVWQCPPSNNQLHSVLDLLGHQCSSIMHLCCHVMCQERPVAVYFEAMQFYRLNRVIFRRIDCRKNQLACTTKLPRRHTFVFEEVPRGAPD